MVQDILRRSTKAICGINEREVTVATKKVQSTINKLKRAGFYVIGKSLDNGPTKIWFTRSGSL